MNKRPYIVAMVVFVMCYVLLEYLTEYSEFPDIVMAILAIIAGVAFWMELENNKRVNEAQLIVELNNQFITNPQLTKIEWELEKYYARYKEAMRNGTDRTALNFDVDFLIENEERQYLVKFGRYCGSYK